MVGFAAYATSFLKYLFVFNLPLSLSLLLSLSLSLSLCIYIYIYIYLLFFMYIYIRINIKRNIYTYIYIYTVLGINQVRPLTAIPHVGLLEVRLSQRAVFYSSRQRRPSHACASTRSVALLRDSLSLARDDELAPAQQRPRWVLYFGACWGERAAKDPLVQGGILRGPLGDGFSLG